MTPEIEAEALSPSAPATANLKPPLTDFWAVVLVVLTGVSYGSQAIIGKWAYANGGNAITVLTVRSVIAMVLVWLIIAFLKPNLRIPVRKIIELSFLGVIFVSSSVTYYVSLMYVPVDYVTDEIADRQLVRVLEDWMPANPDSFFLYYPSRRQQPAALRALISSLRADLKANGKAPPRLALVENDKKRPAR